MIYCIKPNEGGFTMQDNKKLQDNKAIPKNKKKQEEKKGYQFIT